MINSIVRSRTHKSNPKLEWESIGAHIMRTGLARISEDNGETYPKATEAPTPQTLPAAPTAARIYTQTPDGEWVTHCLVFDLDAKKHHSPEDVAHDAHKLTAALAEAGIETITDTSPSGGRHIYVPSRQPIAGHLAQDIVDRLKAHLQLTTCDITPMRGYRSGIIRTPGSPHKHGGHQSLITPLTDALHILEHGNRTIDFAAYVHTLPVAIKSKRIDPAIYEPNTEPSPSPAGALSYGWKRYATTGTFRHLKAAKGGRYPSASEARLGFLAYLARAGYDYPTIRRNTHTATWPALADAYAKYSPEERERLMTREWALAATEHGTRRARTQKAPVNPVHYLLRATTPIWATKKANSRKRDRQTAIRQWATLTDVHGTDLYGGSEAALSLRLVLKALSAQAYRSGSTVFTCSYRTLRLYTGLSLGTIRNVMTRLLTEETPLLELAYHGGMNRPNSYRLIIPETHAQLATTAYVKGIISPLPQAFYGLDKAAWFIFHTFTRRNKHTLAELIRITGISARRVARVVKMLVSENFLAETVKGGVKAWCMDQWCDLEELAFWTDGSMTYAQLNAEVTEQQSQWKQRCLRYYRTMKDSLYTKYITEPNVYRGSSLKLIVSRLCADLNSKVQRTRRGGYERTHQPMLRRTRKPAPAAAPEPTLEPTGDPYLDAGPDPAFKQRRLRGWALAGVITLTVPTLWVFAMSQGFKMNRQAPPTEDLVRQGASDYGCGLSRVWFTWDSDNPDARGTALKVYNPSWDSRRGWNGQGKQSVAYTTSPITKKVEGKDREYDVTCGIFFSDPSIAPVFDTVRVLAGENYGEYSPLSMPAPVSNPALPVPGQAYRDEAVVHDLQAQPNVSTPVTAQIRSYMDAWGKGDRTVLQALITGDMTPAPLSGGLYLASPSDASEIKVYQAKDLSRTYADVKVRWSSKSGAVVEANYRLDFVQKDGRWLVSKIDSIPLDQKAYVSQNQ